MSNIYSNDDDIFEDYVEDVSTQSDIDETISSENVDKVFPDIDSPFKTLIKNSSLKVNFGEAFYQASHEWQIQGYREANNSSILDELVRITNGEFLYRHRLALCREAIIRKKIVINFLDLVLKDESTIAIVRSAKEDLNLNFSETYFHMFFKSFYNIHLHTYHQEVALYRALCEMTNTQVDETVCDLEFSSEPLTNIAEHINNLYIQYFDSTSLREKIQEHVLKIFPSQE